MCNKSLSTGTLPSFQKRAVVTPGLKKWNGSQRTRQLSTDLESFLLVENSREDRRWTTHAVPGEIRSTSQVSIGLPKWSLHRDSGSWCWGSAVCWWHTSVPTQQGERGNACSHWACQHHHRNQGLDVIESLETEPQQDTVHLDRQQNAARRLTDRHCCNVIQGLSSKQASWTWVSLSTRKWRWTFMLEE